MEGLRTDGEVSDIPERKIKADICRKYEYRVVRDPESGKPVEHIATFRNRKGEVVGQKIRGRGKKFRVIGRVSEVLMGCHLFRDGGKRLVITEGEIDALAGAQALGDWPVVSIPNGAAGAKKAIQANLEWIGSFNEIVLAFDNDEPGQTAAAECVLLLPPGKGKLASLPQQYKDFGEALEAQDEHAIRRAVWEARLYKPDGVLGADDIWERLVSAPPIETFLYPWQTLNLVTRGLRKGELVVVTAGTGVGKSAISREIVYDLVVNQHQTVGCLFLEEDVRRAALGFMGLHENKPLHLETDIDVQQHRAAFDATAGSGRLYLYDHFGSMDPDRLMGTIRYMVLGLGCTFVLLDHISIVVSGLTGNDERKDIDVIMTRLRTLVQETKAGIIAVSHLKRPDGDVGHERGLQPQLSHLRGSQAIAQLPNTIIGVARDQQAEDAKERNQSRVSVLKNRFSGETGPAGRLTYNVVTGRIVETAPAAGEPEDDEL